MPQCIDYMCAIFLQSVFSSVSSNDVGRVMHSHSGYICEIFLQSEFSNVASTDAMLHWLHFFEFLLNEFSISNASLKSTYAQLNDHIYCILSNKTRAMVWKYEGVDLKGCQSNKIRPGPIYFPKFGGVDWKGCQSDKIKTGSN